MSHGRVTCEHCGASRPKIETAKIGISGEMTDVCRDCLEDMAKEGTNPLAAWLFQTVEANMKAERDRHPDS